MLASLTIGNTTNAPITAQPYQSSATISPTSLPVNEAPVIAHSLQLPSHSHHDTPDSGGGNQATNLVKPSFVTPTPSPSTMMTPPDFKDAPEFPPLPTTPSKQRPYGPWMLKPFPPPTPSHSLVPAPAPTPHANHGSVITREMVRDAVLELIQVSSLACRSV